MNDRTSTPDGSGGTEPERSDELPEDQPFQDRRPENGPDADTVQGQRFGTSAQPIRNILVGMTFAVDDSAAFKTSAGPAAEIKTLLERLLISHARFKSARRLIARAAQVDMKALPIVVALGDHEISIGVAACGDVPWEMLMNEAGPICDAILSAWRRGAMGANSELMERARRVSALEGDCIENAEANLESGEPPLPSAANTSRPESSMESNGPTNGVDRNVVHLDPIEKSLKKVLLETRHTGNVRLSFVCKGLADSAPALTVLSGVPLPTPNISLAMPRLIQLVVHRMTKATECEVKVKDESKMCLATFSASDKVATQLAMLTRFPAVEAEVRDYVADERGDQLRHAFRIEKITDLSPEWDQGNSPLDLLQACVDDLFSLLVARRKRLKKRG